MDFPSGTMDRNLPAKTRDTGLIPGPGKARVPQLPSPCSRVLEPQLLKPVSLDTVLHNKRSHCNKRSHGKKSVHYRKE